MNILIDLEVLRKNIGHITVGVNDFATFENEAKVATLEFILPYIGSTLHENLYLYWKEPDRFENSGQTEKYKELLELMQSAICNYTALKYVPSSDTFFTANGLQTIKTDKQTGSFAYQKIDRMNKYSSIADTFFEAALLFIENNMDTFPEYNGQAANHWLFRSPCEFSKFYHIGNSRRTFIRLLPIIRRVEMLEIEPVLGEYYYPFKKYVVEAKKHELDSYFNNWIFSVKSALANLTMQTAIRELTLRPVADALQLVSFYQGSKNQDNANFIEQVAEKTSLNGKAFLKKIESDIQKIENSESVFKNKTNSKHFIF